MATFIAIIIGLAVAFYFLPVNQHLGRFLDHVQSPGIRGPVLLAVDGFIPVFSGR